MSSLITLYEKQTTSNVFSDIFDTWSRPIIIYKEPIKTQILPENPNNLFGFGSSQSAELFTYTPVSGIYPALIRYQNKFSSREDTFIPEVNEFTENKPLSIKVKNDCKNFILVGKTIKIQVDNLIYILTNIIPRPELFWNSEFYIFDLERQL